MDANLADSYYEESSCKGIGVHKLLLKIGNANPKRMVNPITYPHIATRFIAETLHICRGIWLQG
eukprot:7318794-Karenia_brevis.AAC.1